MGKGLKSDGEGEDDQVMLAYGLQLDAFIVCSIKVTTRASWCRSAGLSICQQ